MSDTIRRAYLGVTPLTGDRVDLDPDEAHHLTRVLRLKAGDAVFVFDGRGGEWEATIDAASRDGVSLVVGAIRAGNVEPELRVTVFQSLTRPERIEWVLQKGTEIGVSAFCLFASHRADAPTPSPSRMARYERILMEACKQSGRRVLPKLVPGALATPDEGVLAIILSPGVGVVPLQAVLAGPKAREVWLAVGPEGGFSEDELKAASSSGWKHASLGPRVLRTETAGAIASAIVLHTWGDLGR